MMRNCFKRYDKANGNIDFNSVGSSNNTGAANTTQGGTAAGTAGGAVAMSSQPSSNTQTQQAPSPLTKSGTTHHKSHKSITLTQQQMQNVRIKPFWQYSFLRRIRILPSVILHIKLTEVTLVARISLNVSSLET